MKRKHEQCKLHNIFIMHKAKGCQFTLLLYNPDQFQSDEVMIHNVRSKAAVKLRCDSIKSVKCFIDIIYQRRRNALMQVTIFVVKKETYSTYFCNETCQVSCVIQMNYFATGECCTLYTEYLLEGCPLFL